MSKRHYTKKHLDFLRTGYLTMNTRDLTKAFNERFGMDKTESQIKAALSNHKITCGRTGSDRLARQRRWYTDDHERFVRCHCPHVSKKRLVEMFNERFGMNMTISKMKAFFANRSINSGRTGYFPKNHKPWNTGTKGLTKPNSGQFKIGHVPANTRPLYSERIGKNGYIEIKVPKENPYTGCPTRFKQKHVWVYEQNFGPAPKGHAIIFRDQNKRNFDPGNLVAVKRADLARLNQLGYKAAPEEVRPSILALAKLKTKVGEAQRGMIAQ